MQRKVIVYPGESGYWIAECPSLKGCISQGHTKAEALENIKEALELYLETLQEDNIPIPEDELDVVTVAV